MQCPRCQLENREGVRFCEECGTKLDQVCPACGTVIPPDRKFCGACGTPLTIQTPTPGPDRTHAPPVTDRDRALLSYTPPYLTDKILASRSALEGERKQVTVLFADISGFTALSETMDPEDVRQVMNACFAQLVPVVEKYGGTVDKFIGDEIMALFGAPVVRENDPERAVHTALEMMDAGARRLQYQTGHRPRPPLWHQYRLGHCRWHRHRGAAGLFRNGGRGEPCGAAGRCIGT